MTITRRDFLNGMALGIAAGLTPLQHIAAATRAALGTYIPGDDFGGHAKCNEFATSKGTLLIYGGSESLRSPHSIYSQVATDFIHNIGIDLKLLSVRATSVATMAGLG